MKRLAFSNERGLICQRLGPGGPGENVFQTWAQLIAFAAALGVKKNQYEPFTAEETAQNPAAVRHEAMADFVGLVDTIALHKEQDLDILSDNREDERADHFSFYANGGLAYLEREYPNELQVDPKGVISNVVNENNPNLNNADIPDIDTLLE